MFIPEPQEDEADFSLLGRICKLNRIESEIIALSALQQRFSYESACPLKHQKLLAKAAHISEAEFISRHTLAPFHFGFLNDPLSASTAIYQKHASIMYKRRKFSGKAYLCVSCAQRDVKLSGYSYWRRIHHVPGVDYCPTHDHPLLSTSRLRNYLPMPHTFIDDNDLTNPNTSKEVHRNDIIKRYESVSKELLTSYLSPAFISTQERINVWAQMIGLYIGYSRGILRPTLADVAARTLPSSWLAKHFSGMAPRTKNSYIGILNRTTYCSGSTSAEHFALSIALMSSPAANDMARSIVAQAVGMGYVPRYSQSQRSHIKKSISKKKFFRIIDNP